MKDDKIEFTILPDGSVKWETEKISNANHATAEALTRALANELGGESVRKVRGKHSHSHGTNQHQHEH